MAQHTIQYTLAGGEVSDLFLARRDINRYYSSLLVCENFVTIPTGGARRRYGLEYLATLGTSTHRLESFEFSVAQAYMLAFGERLTQVFQDRAFLLEVTTPYRTADLFDLQMTQSADVQFHAHPLYPQAKLSRTSATAFQYDVIAFRPPAFFEQDTILSGTLTLSGLSGTITATASTATFLRADVGREILAGTGVGVIQTLVSATAVTVLVTSAFTDVTYVQGAWRVTGSPVGDLRMTEANPIGALTDLTLTRSQDDAVELLTNGGFADSSSWTDYSGALLVSAVADGGSDTSLIDASQAFITDGIRPGHVVLNLSDSPVKRDTVVLVVGEGELLLTSEGASITSLDPYEIRETGTARFVDDVCQLAGGVNGRGWIEQVFTSETDVVYEMTFDVTLASISVQVGSDIQRSDVLAEATYEIKNEHTVTFTAVSGFSYVQFRNTQNTVGAVDNVSVKAISIAGWRATDVGKFLAVNNGVAEIQTVVNTSQATAIIWVPFESTDTAIAGAWVLGTPSWSADTGYPRALSFHGGRLWYFATLQQPLTGWGSVVGLFDAFSPGTKDADAVEVEISANQMNTIEWAEPFQDLFIGTRGGEHLLTGGTNPITPTNVAQIPQDTEGSPPLRPIRVGNRLLHVSRGRRTIREMSLDRDTGLIEVEDITLLAAHITASGIVQLAFQRHPEKILWGVRADGVLIGYSFELPEEVRGWHRHPTDGLVESVAVLPVDDSSTEETEEVYLVVNRAGTRFLEVMRPEHVTGNTRQAALTLDSAVRFDFASPTRTFSGLGHLEGRTVTMVQREAVTTTDRKGQSRTVDRLTNHGTAVVAGGAVTSPVPVARMDIGLPYVPRLVTLPPEIDTREGSIAARLKRWARIHVEVYETIGLTINGVRESQQVGQDVLDAYIEPRTGQLEGEGTDWSVEAPIELRQEEPLPVTILGIMGELEVSEAN